MDASNTSYQRAVADMRAANLNPILAYSQGGASTPTAPVADTSNLNELGKAGTNAINTASALAQIDNTRQQTNLSLAQEANTRQQTLTSSADQALMLAQAREKQLINAGMEKLPPHIRAWGQLAGSTGVGIGMAQDSGVLKQGANNLRWLRDKIMNGRSLTNFRSK